MIGGDPAHSSFAQINLNFPLVITQTITAGHEQEAGMTVSEDKLFISDRTELNRLVVADLFSGEVLWSFELPFTGGGMNFIPAVSDGVVVVGGQGAPGLYAFDSETGDSLWFLPVLSLYSRCPVISDALIYVPARDSLVCVHLHSGIIQWSFINIIPQTSPAVDAQQVYFCSNESLYALYKMTGDTAWVNDTIAVGHFMSLSVDNTYLYTGFVRHISALDKDTGAEAWSVDLADDEILIDYPHAFAMTQEHLLVKFVKDGTSTNQYLLLDKTSGQEVQRFEGGAMTYSAPTILNDDVVDYSEGHLLFFDLISGMQSYEMTQLPVTGNSRQIIAAADKLYISGDGPNVIVLEEILSSVHDEISQMRLDVFPNPMRDQLEFSFTLQNASDLTLRIYHHDGVLTEQRNLGFWNGGDHNLSIPLSHLLAGAYLIELCTDTEYATQRILVHE